MHTNTMPYCTSLSYSVEFFYQVAYAEAQHDSEVHSEVSPIMFPVFSEEGTPTRLLLQRPSVDKDVYTHGCVALEHIPSVIEHLDFELVVKVRLRWNEHSYVCVRAPLHGDTVRGAFHPLLRCF